MGKVCIHQMTATMSMGDAISNEVLALRNILQEMGIESNIYAENIDPRLNEKIIHYTKYNQNQKDVIIHHFGIGSDINDYVMRLKNLKILRYHNITPPKFFEGYNPVSSRLCEMGRKQLSRAAGIYRKCLADSDFNKEELLELGYKNIEVIPILLRLEDYEQEPSQKIIQNYAQDDYTNILFVGRVAPNKKQEDIIKSFYYYNKYFNEKSRLFIVGSYDGMEKYYKQLRDMIEKFNIKNVIFTGHIAFRDILAYYRISDLFLCMSEHEGFCVPLVESMFFKLPIIAYNACAIPYTLGKSGVLVNQKDYTHIAGMIDYIISDSQLKTHIIEKQSERLNELHSTTVKQQFKEYIEKVI